MSTTSEANAQAQPITLAAKPTASKAAPKKKEGTKAEKPKAQAPGQNASISAGQRLADLKLPAPLAAIARKLASDQSVTRAQLVTLRDGINAHADQLRGDGKKAAAAKLSAANRLVRRLERAARKGR